MRFEAIVIGVSWGGMQAVKQILPRLPKNFKLPVIIVQHISPGAGNDWIELLDNMCGIKVKEADEKEKITAGIAYIAPAGYHLLIENDSTFSLSLDERVNYARPSVDVLFECAADVFAEKTIGIILTGLNSDGAKGLKRIKDSGGVAIVQDPTTAESGEMPHAALKATVADYVLPLDKIAGVLIDLEQQVI
jgi:two-component system chemotaxis response regulator CheB